MYKLWEDLTETTDQAADSVVVLAVEEHGIQAVAVSPEAGRRLVVEALVEVETGGIGPCTQLFVATAAKNARFHLGLQPASLFTAAIVLKKWVMAEEERLQDKRDQILDPKLQFQTKVVFNLIP